LDLKKAVGSPENCLLGVLQVLDNQLKYNEKEMLKNRLG
jgi:hypothetical protein